MTAGPGAWLLRAVVVLGWVVWWSGGRRVSGVTRGAWWAGGVLVVAATLATEPAAGLLGMLAGQRWVALVLLHAAVLLAAAAAVEAQAGPLGPVLRWGPTRRGWAVTGTVVVVMTLAWLLDPPGPAAAGEDGGPVVLEVTAGVAIHAALYSAAVTVWVGMFLWRAAQRWDDAPPGLPRQLVGGGAATAGVVGVGTLLGGAALAARLLGWDVPVRVQTVAAAGELLAMGAGLAAAAVIARPGRAEQDQDLRSVAALRDWLDTLTGTGEAGRGPRPARRPGCAPDVLGLVVETRDRLVLTAQRRVTPAQLHAARRAAGRHRLRGAVARAFTVAVALELAAAAGPGARPAQAADLARLGGGRTPAQELRWLALVARTRVVYPAAAVARAIARSDPAAAMLAPAGVPGPRDRHSVEPVAASPRAAGLAAARGWGPADDEELVAAARARLAVALAGPPRSLQQLAAAAAALLDAPVSIDVSTPAHPAAPVGAWVQLSDGTNVVWVHRATSPLHRLVITCHEFGHIFSGHRPTPLAAFTARRRGRIEAALGRCGQPASPGSAEWVTEREAEITGRLLAHALLDPGLGTLPRSDA